MDQARGCKLEHDVAIQYGIPSDAGIQNQFLLPRNVDGALNTTAFATAKRNEIALAEQAEQLSQVVTQAITLAKAQEV